ncbi:MAG: TlpA family protein disulfide reductase [Fibrobacteres bacterium]|nr:TlpA family protein disulfide reductase [Fibrobacterota bacterium]
MSVLRVSVYNFLFAAATLSAAFAGPKPGAPAPGFELPHLLDAGEAGLKDYSGSVVVLDFWASWCAPCAKTLPRLSRMGAGHPGLAVLALSIDEDKGKALDFLGRKEKANPSLTYLHDRNRAVAEAYDLDGMPSLVIVDRKGLIRYRHDGYTESDFKVIEAEIAAVMGGT